ncbi:autotransporter outer membrane beta-barrel domain-containing protein [Sutterella seckii]|uniref:Autotransporter outer membrane beta-barrel domain-containing protein n=1 Tax=Sutterella seckii TaxID=1944635 RepID=A0A6I1ENC8_9BURK|nr:autotransporter domain-containing protein [Sutterella seckii]KAB7649679.1 autotransporter outer membrane beta-barrel domain-containing protein [Sutterella seckii]
MKTKPGYEFLSDSVNGFLGIHVNMQSTMIEVGGALNYTDTDLDLVNGSGDGDIYGAALYASRLFENGSFIDLIGRYGHLINIGTK